MGSDMNGRRKQEHNGPLPTLWRDQMEVDITGSHKESQLPTLPWPHRLTHHEPATLSIVSDV